MANFDSFRIILEEYERQYRLLEPSIRVFQDLVNRTNIDDLMQRQMRIFQEALPTSIAHISPSLSLLKQLSDSVERFKGQFDAVRHMDQYASAIAEAIQLQPSNIWEEIFRKQSEIEQSQKTFLSVIANLHDPVLPPIDRINDHLARFAAIYECYDLSNKSFQFILQPSIAYQEFVTEQFMRLEDDNAEIALRRAKIVDLSGNLLTASQMASEIALNARIDAEEESDENGEGDELTGFDENKMPVNLYKVLNQHVGYVYRPQTSTNVAEAFTTAKPARICSFGVAIVELIYQINNSATRNGEASIFKPTNRGIYACSIIPTRIAQNEQDFAEVIDHLYFLLYEGSGTAKRLTPFVDDATLDFLWLLKHLRLSFRHDIEHGSEKEITKKHQNIATAYKKLIGMGQARTPKDWTLAQLVLYENLVLMLDKISKAQQ